MTKSRKINTIPATWEVTIPTVKDAGIETRKITATKCFVEGGALYFQDETGEVAGFNTWNNYQRVSEPAPPIQISVTDATEAQPAT